MTGFLLLILLALMALALMRLAGLRGAMLTLAGAALAFGGAGYALQGRPGLMDSPRSASERRPPLPLGEARATLMGQFGPNSHWLVIADSFTRRGDTAGAVGVLRSAIRAHPQDYQLWVGLGNALADHARSMTPAARFAFERAIALAPKTPAPRFFLGLALARSGQPEEGVALWREILASAPPNASWRPFIEDAVLAAGGPPARR